MHGNERFLETDINVVGMDKPMYYNPITKSFGKWNVSKRSVLGTVEGFWSTESNFIIKKSSN